MEPKVYWLMSAPKTREDTFLTVCKQTQEVGYPTNDKFQIPELKVGTLDTLMTLSDSLTKQDVYVEQVTRKIALQLAEVMDKTEANSNLNKMDIFVVHNSTIDQFIKFFKWDEAKYPTSQPLKTLADSIHSFVIKLDEEERAKNIEYNNVIHALNSEERKLGGNLLTKDLSDVVKPQHVVETEYMETIFVAVPKTQSKQWLNSYERLTDFVLPRSSEKIDEDAEYALFRVIVFRKVAEDFKNLCREQKLGTPRDYRHDPNRSSKADKKKLETEKEKLRKNLIRWCKTNFSECFIGWIHLKAIRIFVESVLRYGLPTNFQAILLLPQKNKIKKLRHVLHDQFKHLGSKVASAPVGKDEAEEGEEEKFYPYVFLEINIDFQKTLGV